MRSRYHEREIMLQDEPLALVGALLRNAPQGSLLMYEREGEWSFAFGEEHAVIATRGSVALRSKAGTRTWSAHDPLAAVQDALASLPLTGWRAYGTSSFELAYLLHDLDLTLRPESDEPLVHLTIPVTEVRLRSGAALVRSLDREQLSQIAQLVAQLDARADRSVEPPERIRYELHHAADDYKALVSAAMDEIAQRKLHKVIASRVVRVNTPVDLVATYTAGRRQNSPARSFVVWRGDTRMVGFSPETVLEVAADGRITTQPLAGTRALGSDVLENARLLADLMSDAKELAEHAMSVKLAFDELSRVCRSDSVHVVDFMGVSRRGTVQHLCSRLAGMLAEGQSAWTAFGVLFPGVTASGIPKREAVDWIRRHEVEQRGLYSGAVLRVEHDGAMDAALVLRSVFQQGHEFWLRAGAGVVAQSTPERELEETCEKLESVARHLIPYAVAPTVA